MALFLLVPVKKKSCFTHFPSLQSLLCKFDNIFQVEGQGKNYIVPKIPDINWIWHRKKSFISIFPLCFLCTVCIVV